MERLLLVIVLKLGDDIMLFFLFRRYSLSHPSLHVDKVAVIYNFFVESKCFAKLFTKRIVYDRLILVEKFV